MKSFARNLIARHTMPETNVSPRLRGRFEPNTAAFSRDNISARHDVVLPDVDLPRPDDESVPGVREEFSISRPRIKLSGEPIQPVNEPPRSAEKPPAEHVLEPVGPALDAAPPATNVLETREATFDSEPPLETGETFLEAGEPVRPAQQHNFNSIISPAGKENIEEVPILPVTPTTVNYAEAMHMVSGNAQKPAQGAHRWVNTSKPKAGFKNSDIKIQNDEVNSIDMPQTSPVSPQFSSGAGKSFGDASKPVIKVSIGRIEVHAVMPAAPPPVKSREPSKPRLSLDDFLNQHKRNEQ